MLYEASTTLDEQTVTFMIDVASKTKNGSVCVTTNPSVTYSARPENHIAEHKDSNSVIELLNEIKTVLPESEKLVKITDPVDFFLRSYEDVTEFSWRKEQLLSDRTQQTLASVGVNVTDELMEELIDLGVSYSVEVFTERAKSKLAKHSTMSVEKWEKIRDKIVVINDRMKVEHIVDKVYDILGDLTEAQEQVLEGFQINTKELVDPISAFQMLAQSLNLKIKRLVKMDEPVKTEIYIPYN